MIKYAFTFKLFLSVLILISSGQHHDVNLEKSDVNIAYYEEIKDLPNHPEKLLIDVREAREIIETGQIPTSINIPLSDIEQALSNKTSPEIFKQSYGREKPDLNTPTIFTCRSGSRALKAYRIAEILGYKNIKNYQGSWLDWAERENLPKN